MQITNLTFRNNLKFNKSINNRPKSRIHLILGEFSEFNQLVNNLPQSITHLTFIDKHYDDELRIGHQCENRDNRPIVRLPKSIKKLILRGNFNTSIDHLPNSINTLIIGGDFDKSVNNLPNSITTLILGYSFIKLKSTSKLPTTIYYNINVWRVF